jgi:ACS family sodium-dependent inorganic phosphate cotransporter-like MFS transporter 5
MRATLLFVFFKAIVCMVNNTAIAGQSGSLMIGSLNETSSSISTGECSSTVKSHHSMDGPFAWSKSIQGVLLSAYFYGYLITQIPGGWLSYRFGGKNVLACSMAIAAFFTLLMPVTARWHVAALVICRLIVGLAHGVFWPSVSSIFIYWTPPAERSRLVGMASAGSWVGNIIALPFAGFLCTNGDYDFFEILILFLKPIS